MPAGYSPSGLLRRCVSTWQCMTQVPGARTSMERFFAVFGGMRTTSLGTGAARGLLPGVTPKMWPCIRIKRNTSDYRTARTWKTLGL